MKNKNYDPEEQVNSHSDGEYLEDYSDFKPTAIPKPDDELWDDAEGIFDKYTSPTEGGYGADYTYKYHFFKELKSKYTISKKQ